MSLPLLRNRFVGAIVLLLGLCLGAVAPAAATALDHFELHDPYSLEVQFHTLWSYLLQRYVVKNPESGQALVQYNRVSPADRKILENYLAEQGILGITRYNQDEQLFYWVNLYNALVWETVLRYYPLRSLYKMRAGSIFSHGVYDAKIVRVEGVDLSLSDIRNKIVLSHWKEPRILYLFCDGSLGSPNLLPVAITKNNWDWLSKKAARDFINSSNGVRIEKNKLIVSKIYKDYKKYFHVQDDAILAHLREFAYPDLEKQLQAFKKTNKYQDNALLNQDPLLLKNDET